MKLTELSNPTDIHTDFVYFSKFDRTRQYKNKNDGKFLRCTLRPDNEYMFSYDDYTYKQNLGASVALSIFKTVLYDIKTYVIDKNEQCIYFTADSYETSRIKLYNTLAKMLMKFGYIRIETYQDIKHYFENPEFIYDKLDNNEYVHYMFVKKDSNIIPLDEVRNPSKPSDKFRLVKSDMDDGNGMYVYITNDQNEDGQRDKLSIVFSKFYDSVDILFEINQEMAQSPQYAHLAMAVFQTVLYQVIQYANKYNPKILKFSASPTEPTRVSLYKRICKNITGYNVEELHGNFILTREE